MRNMMPVWSEYSKAATPRGMRSYDLELMCRSGQYVKENDVDVKKVVADTLAERRGGDVDMA